MPSPLKTKSTPPPEQSWIFQLKDLIISALQRCRAAFTSLQAKKPPKSRYERWTAWRKRSFRLILVEFLSAIALSTVKGAAIDRLKLTFPSIKDFFKTLFQNLTPNLTFSEFASRMRENITQLFSTTDPMKKGYRSIYVILALLTIGISVLSGGVIPILLLVGLIALTFKMRRENASGTSKLKSSDRIAMRIANLDALHMIIALVTMGIALFTGGIGAILFAGLAFATIKVGLDARTELKDLHATTLQAEKDAKPTLLEMFLGRSRSPSPLAPNSRHTSPYEPHRTPPEPVIKNSGKAVVAPTAPISETGAKKDSIQSKGFQNLSRFRFSARSKSAPAVLQSPANPNKAPTEALSGPDAPQSAKTQSSKKSWVSRNFPQSIKFIRSQSAPAALQSLAHPTLQPQKLATQPSAEAKDKSAKTPSPPSLLSRLRNSAPSSTVKGKGKGK